jgi:hypothetical protein
MPAANIKCELNLEVQEGKEIKEIKEINPAKHVRREPDAGRAARSSLQDLQARTRSPTEASLVPGLAGKPPGARPAPSAEAVPWPAGATAYPAASVRSWRARTVAVAATAYRDRRDRVP